MDQLRHAATKLTVPTPVRPVLARPHLHDRLDQRDYRVGVVSAPAGFGKTVLLATWTKSKNDSAVWMSCNSTDSEPARFWDGLLSSVGARWPGVGEDAATMLKRGTFSTDDLAIALANDLGETNVPISIVIDDFHLAPRTPAAFASLVSVLPANVQLVVGTRVDPPLPLGRLRVAGSLLELHSDDLSFSSAETAAALELNGVTTTTTTVDRLHDLTEGWPAGVQLATLAMLSTGDHDKFLEAFASTDRAVAEFLVDEVLDAQDPELVDFLYTTSVLEEFDAELCDEVSGHAGARRLLDQLVAANLFIVRLDVGDGWYRYHHLFKAFLRARLRSSGGNRWRETHERAARALEARGDIVGALRQSVAGGNPKQPAEIVRRTTGRWINVTDTDTTSAVVTAWLEQYGRDLVVSDPEQVLEFLVTVVATSNPDDSVWWFTQIAQAHPTPAPTTLCLLHGVWAEHHLARGQPDQAVPHVLQAVRAMKGETPPVGLASALTTLLIRCGLQADDDAMIADALASAVRQPTGHPVVDTVRIPGLRAWCALQQGELRQAEPDARVAIAAADERGLAPSDIGRIFGGLTIARIHLERNDFDAARQTLNRLRYDAELSRRSPMESLVALNEAILARTLGDEESAAANLQVARLCLPHASHAVRSRFDIEAVLQAIQFDRRTALGLIEVLGDHRRVPMLRIRLALANGDTRAAATELENLPPAVSLRDRVLANVVVALTTIDHDIEVANAAFTTALTEAQTQGLSRTVLDVAPDMSKVLISIAPTAALELYVNQLINTANTVTAGNRPEPVTSLVEQLSVRELTVLRYLCSRLTYQEIASALYVSLNTLKSHVKSVYRKLEVASRQEAVEVGRRLHIV